MVRILGFKAKSSKDDLAAVFALHYELTCLRQ
jgi:hypothetical protein